MISQVSNALVNVLKKSLSNELPRAGQIGLYVPQEKGEVSIGLYLYSIRNCAEVNSPAIAAIGRNIKAVPPRFLTLHYLLTAFSNAELNYRALDEHRLLTLAMEAFEKTPTLNQSNLGFKPGVWVDELKLQLVDLDMNDMSRAWENPEVPYKLSVAYKVTPVELNVAIGNISQRIGQSDTKLKENERNAKP